MAGPVKIKAPSETLANGVDGVQELTVVEIKNYTANILTTQFASSTDVGSLQVGTSGAPTDFTSVGTFTNREMNNAVGTHPVDPNDFTSTVYTFSQGTATATDSKTARPVRLNSSNSLEQSSDAEIDSEVIDDCIKAMVDQDDNTCGQYYLSASAPAGGTWTSRGTIVDTQVDGTDVTKTLWQKTAATTVPSATTNRTVVKSVDGEIQEFTDAEIQALEGRFRNRIAANNIGKYVVDTAAPGTGTWQQMGETLTDQLKNTQSYAYVGNYTGSYTDSYSGTYTGYYTGSYSGTYTGYYTGTYSGTYTGYYARFFGGFLNGNFAGNYTGFYSGAYTGNYTGSYSGTYTGFYTGSYSGTYSGTYTGYYAGVTVISTSSTQESKKLFVRIA